MRGTKHMDIKFSLLLATLNRPEILKTCIDALLKQTYCNYEIIIVDQSDKEFCDNSIAAIDSRIKYIHIDKKGLSHARNIGLQYVTGDYVCLVDDDGLYEQKYLETSNKLIKKMNPTVLIGLLIDPAQNKPASDLNDCRIGWKNVFNGLCSACMIIKAGFLKTVKFDENFGVGSKYGSGEETDILLTALKQNKIIFFSRQIKMYHQNPIVEDIPIQKIKNYAFGYGALCKKMFIMHSKFWGFYYIAKTVVGNFVLWIMQNLKSNKDAAKKRKARAIYTVKGFISYKYK